MNGRTDEKSLVLPDVSEKSFLSLLKHMDVLSQIEYTTKEEA